jgi:biopolymer transport protein ExbB/TolQ
LWSVAIALAVAIPAATALVAVNRQMNCLANWMDHATALGEASFNIPSSFTIYNFQQILFI